MRTPSTRYQQPTSTRRESRTISGRFRGGKLAPVMAVALRESESCMLSQSVTYELDPIAGRMITPITAELISVFVPVQACDAIRDPDQDYPGNTEVIRDKLLSGAPLFGMEAESELTKRMGIVPRSTAGVKQVSQIARLAHNAAVNYLRQRKFVDCVKVLASNFAVTPALISQTVLDRLNGVLDPEDRVNGMVEFQTGTITAPVHAGGALPLVNHFLGDSPVASPDNTDGSAGTGNGYPLLAKRASASAPASPVPGVTLPALEANLAGLNIGSVSLTAFYDAEQMDKLTRQMRAIVDANPEWGQEQIQRWAHGLSVDFGKNPFVIHQSTTIFGQQMAVATDTTGVNTDVMRSDMLARISFTVPVPASELGGVVVTFACVKPDETIASQPHPFLADVWGATNYVSDEMLRDPVPVTIREINAECATGDENTIAFYTGHNELKRGYVNYGFNRHIDLETVANKTAIWQLEVPMSVGPQSVLYPANLAHYPFSDETAEVCTYTISSVQTVNTPIIFGPTPVEELAIIETANVFGDA